MSHPVRYTNDKSSLLDEIESKQGATYFPASIYVHTDNDDRTDLSDHSNRSDVKQNTREVNASSVDPVDTIVQLLSA